MSAYITPAIALVSAIAALATLLITLHSSRRSDRDSAREEALALAELRGQMLVDMRADFELRIRRLEEAVAALAQLLDGGDEPPATLHGRRRMRTRGA